MSIADKSFINNLPRKENFLIKNGQLNLDIEDAIIKYLGKDIKYVKKYFCSQSCYGVLEDIRYIGDAAFSYYLMSIIDCIMDLKLDSNEGVDVYDVLCELPDIVEEKIAENRKEIKKYLKYISYFIQWVLEHEKYIVSDYLLCDNLRHKYKKLENIIFEL